MPEIKKVYTEADKYKVAIYVNVNTEGNIIECCIGKAILPTKPYDYFFFEEVYVGESIENYKVVITDNKPQLQAIDTVLEQELKDAYFQADKDLLQQQYEQRMAELALLEQKLQSLE